MSSVKIKTAGPLTTIQDKGRIEYQQSGMSVSGVMDDYSFRAANLLVGNPETEAVLEMQFLP
jgi:antagonist of KipI